MSPSYPIILATVSTGNRGWERWLSCWSMVSQLDESGDESQTQIFLVPETKDVTATMNLPLDKPRLNFWHQIRFPSTAGASPGTLSLFLFSWRHTVQSTATSGQHPRERVRRLVKGGTNHLAMGVFTMHGGENEQSGAVLLFAMNCLSLT